MVNGPTAMTVSEFLHHLDDAWAELQAFIASLTPEQITVPTDAAGWTVKGHLMHLVVWEDGINALLEQENRRERMSVDEDLWASRDFDAINAAIQQQHHQRTLNDVLATLQRTHITFRRYVAGMSDADLHRPYSDFVPTGSATMRSRYWLARRR